MKNINKKNYFKLFLLGLLTPLFIGSCFAFDLTVDEISYLDNNAMGVGSFSNVSNYVLFSFSSDVNNVGVCVVFSGLTFTYNQASDQYYNIVFTNDANMSSFNATMQGSTLPYFIFCTTAESPHFNYLKILPSQGSSLKFSANKYWVVRSEKLFNGSLGFDIQGLLDNYNNCQSDLNNCDTITNQCLEDKSILSGQLASCNADKVSLNNNIDSLTLQLQNCLGQSCGGSGDIGTGLFYNQYSLYRTDDETDYSTPITNNLFLPLGYKGKINEDNILSIAKINTLETAYQFSDSDKPVVINSMGFVMLFFLGTGLLIVVIMYLRRFISKK